jgi:hypothetical protein
MADPRLLMIEGLYIIHIIILSEYHSEMCENLRAA